MSNGSSSFVPVGAAFTVAPCRGFLAGFFFGLAGGGVDVTSGLEVPSIAAPQNGHDTGSSSRTDWPQEGHVGRSMFDLFGVGAQPRILVRV